MNTTAINQQSNGRQAIRVLGLVAVLALSAALGLVVGNALKGNEAPTNLVDTAPIAGTATFSLDALRHVQAARGDAGAELTGATYVDPYRAHIQGGIDADRENASLTRPTGR